MQEGTMFKRAPSQKPIKEHSIILSELKPLYCGIWAENLTTDQELPVGGLRGQAELTTKLKLDFDQFASAVENFTGENIRASYEQEKQALANWLNRTVSDKDLYLIYVANKVLRKMQELLEINPKQPDNASERRLKYNEGTPSLSELKGKAMCAEQAALGQFLLQRIRYRISICWWCKHGKCKR